MDNLDGVLNRVIDWLKYEEAKNAALVALNGVGAGVILQWLSQTCNATGLLTPWLKGSLAAFLISLIIALFSFYPVLKGARLHARSAKRRKRRLKAGSLSDPNILFFDHIAGYCPKEYLRDFRAAAGVRDGGTSLEPYYAREIVANAEIAVMKLRLFEVAVVVSLVGFSATCLAAIVHLVSA